jgi:cytochrome c oxidase accessory protein FixG
VAEHEVKSDTPAPAPATVSLYAKQPTIQVRSVSGVFNRWRWALVWLTQLVFYGLPWLTWNQRPAVLFDLGARRFYIFNLVLYPQDFIYLTALLAIAAYALFLFTAIAGRLWCGYACPQTVYTEIFMAVERWFEGDRNARIRLRRGSWTLERGWRQGGKHAVWLAIALWTGLTFVAYFTPMRQLLGALASLSLSGWEWFWILFYGLATYGNAGFMREQVCKYMCPYARFQSAMFDRQTLIVGYDALRGEPRSPAGSAARKSTAASPAAGDCVDCGLCVQVCPTGIDIRKGLQYECIGCAACIDACDTVMDRFQRPRNLIRYATQVAPSGAAAGSAWHMLRLALKRTRVLIYGSILIVILALLAWSLTQRAPLRVDVVRDRAVLARLVDNGQVENVYRLQLMNATESPLQVELRLLPAAGAPALAGLAVNGRTTWQLAPVEARWISIALRLPPGAAPPGVHPLVVELVTGTPAGVQTLIREKTTFVVPR